MRSLLALLLLTVGLHSSYAQSPGTWEKQLVCDSCTFPVLVDFLDDRHGVLSFTSTRASLPPDALMRSSLLSTVDAGKSWVMHHDTLPNFVWTSTLVPQFRYSSDGSIMYRSSARIFRTSDLGSSHSVVDEQALVDRAALILDDNRIVRYAAPRVLTSIVARYMSYDGGASYSQQDSLAFDTVYTVIRSAAHDSLDFYMVLRGRKIDTVWHRGKIMVTSDGGTSWTTVEPFLPHAATNWSNTEFGVDGIATGANRGTLFLMHNYFRDPENVAHYVDLLITTDYGSTWYFDSSRAPHPRNFARIVRNPAGSNLWAVLGDSLRVLYSSDLGRTWTTDSTTFRGHPIATMDWIDSTRGYVTTFEELWSGSNMGKVYLWRFIPSSAGVEHDVKHVPDELMTARIEGGFLRVRARRTIDGTLRISDILGRPVLAEKLRLTSGAEQAIAAASLAPGAYIGSFQHADGRTSTIRFIRP